MTHLEVRALESEVELPFAGLSVLLAPVLERLERIPEPQRVALAGALGLSSPIPGDPLTVYAATLSLLAAAAEARPLIAVVDDAHCAGPVLRARPALRGPPNPGRRDCPPPCRSPRGRASRWPERICPSWSSPG